MRAVLAVGAVGGDAFLPVGASQIAAQIAEGLQANEGKVKHLGLPKAPARSPFAHASRHRPWQLCETVSTVPLLLDQDRYGTTLTGGSSSDGTAYSLTPPVSPSTTWTQTVLHNFTGGTGDGADLRAGVVIGSGGVLYGVTEGGGSSSEGTIYSLTPPGTSWTETILYNFTGSSGDGAQPYADLLYSSGWLYGTTYSGGSSSDGTVFAWEL